LLQSRSNEYENSADVLYYFYFSESRLFLFRTRIDYSRLIYIISSFKDVSYYGLKH